MVKPPHAAEYRCEAILKRTPDVAVGVEVGVLMGALSARLLAKRPNLALYMVDNWATAAHRPAHYKATGDIHATQDKEAADRHFAAAQRIAAAHKGRAVILRMDSVVAAERFSDGGLDFVFLDADHSYEGVRADLAAWTRKVRPGGWIGGHDFANHTEGYDFTGVERAVREWAGVRPLELDINFTWFCRL